MKKVVVAGDADLDEALAAISGARSDRQAEERRRELTESVRAIVEAVRERGEAAVAEFTKRFDHVSLAPEQFEVTRDEIDAAMRAVDDELLKALERAHGNILAFHAKNLRISWEEVSEDGSVLGQRLTPIDSVGVYVPGGTAFYPSSVLMNIVPARVAGVREIVMVSPPSYQGGVHPLVLAAARIAGATRVFRIGGAQSIAALAYGAGPVPAVLKITGPGNIYVTLAKRLVSTVCDIDKEAGPSEVVVIADDAADPSRAAVELLAQAEHDEEACPYFITSSAATARAVEAELERLMGALPRAATIRKALDGHGAAYLVRNLDDAAALTNAIAPEHLSLQVREPRALLDRISNAGCAVLGGETSVAAGDYYAGPNHILPTGRRARYASPLTADDFRKITSIISFSPERMRRIADDVVRLAKAEGLDAHALAMELRR
jgi:histidinol dehydrogenase